MGLPSATAALVLFKLVEDVFELEEVALHHTSKHVNECVLGNAAVLKYLNKKLMCMPMTGELLLLYSGNMQTIAALVIHCCSVQSTPMLWFHSSHGRPRITT